MPRPRELARNDVRYTGPHRGDPPTDEIDIGTSADVAARLQSVEPTAHIMVDMRGARFCDSSGLGVLLEASKRQEQGHGSLQLVNVEPAVARLIEITGLEFLLADRAG